MSEPSDEELERAERIRKLRSGGATSRSHQRRQQRREEAPDGDQQTTDRAEETREEDRDEADEQTDREDDRGATADAVDDAATTDASDDGGGDTPGPVPSTGDADVLQLAADLPADGSLFVVPVREGLRREFNKVAEQLHLRYGFEYRNELDAEKHVRPLALYLGVQALEDADVEAVKELLESVDVLEAPDAGGEEG